MSEEIRSTKPETRNKFQIPINECPNGLRFWSFEIVSDFDIRISNFDSSTIRLLCNLN